MASTDTKKRKRKPYENKALMMEHLGFGCEKSFDDWRASDLVKPHWERFSKHFLDSPFFKFDKNMQSSSVCTLKPSTARRAAR